MGEKESKKNQLKKISKGSAEKADQELADDLERIRNLTRINLENLRPIITEKGVFDNLVAVVVEATNRNESIAELTSRVKMLGSTAVSMVGEIVKLTSGTGSTGPKGKND